MAEKSAAVGSSESGVADLASSKGSELVSALTRVSDASPQIAVRGAAKDLVSAISAVGEKKEIASVIIKLRGT